MSDLLSSGVNSLYTSNTGATGTAASKALEKALSSTDLSNASDEKLLEVCQDFESYFVEQVFKSMEKMVPKDEDSSTSSSSNSLTDYFKEELVSQYASDATKSNGGKGLGIAQMLYEQMKRNYGTSDSE